MSESPDPYAVLGVTPAATPAQITHAFRVRLRALHPDTGDAGAESPADVQAQLRQLLHAHQLLRHRGRLRSDAPKPRRTSSNQRGPVEVPVTHRRAPARSSREGLWAGPVRRHR